MFIVGFLGWWYGPGWRMRMQDIGARLARVFDFFSIDLLVRTWFSPFRQIGTEQVARGLTEQLRALSDHLVSRTIGGIVRTFTIMAGVIALLVTLVICIVEICVWIFVPLFPLVGAILFAIGWVPYVGI